jgi:hypothetical protein
MGLKYFGLGIAAGLLAVPAANSAWAQQLSPQAMMAQNTYNGGAIASQDSILPDSANTIYPANSVTNLRQEVAAAETNVNISAAFMHTQYHENSQPDSGDDESGFTYGFGAGASALLINKGIFQTDLYTALNYDFSAGDINYGGHYLFGNQPLSATDNAVFNRIEARIGLGFPLARGVEIIPFIAAGYQAWNRNINLKGQIGTDEFYSSGLIGGGVKLDVPLTTQIVASATGEVLAMVGGNVSFNDFGISHGMGPSAEERIALGLDYTIRGPFHAFGTVYWQHFTYSGYKPGLSTYYFYEPLSTTTQFGANLGLAYSF